MADVTKFMDKNLIPSNAKIDSVVENIGNLNVPKTQVGSKVESFDSKKDGRVPIVVKAKYNGGASSRVG